MEIVVYGERLAITLACLLDERSLHRAPPAAALKERTTNYDGRAGTERSARVKAKARSAGK